MASNFNSNTPLPQGFSVYQPALGAQLQFFPALGSQELDDMMSALIPGPAPMNEKRASVSLNFLEHAQSTGKNFKFYTVYSASTSATASSPLSSVASLQGSPTHPNATCHSAGASGSSSVSPRSSATQFPPTRVSKGPKSSRPVTDFSHLPGMKIMTKDGLDVTDSASRGSKTKEQRDHAHLMRIIKACDSCRRKKVRCDPSHKKRTAASSHSPQLIAKPTKKAPTAVQKPSAKPSTKPLPVALPTTDDAFRISQSTFPLQPDFTFSGLETIGPFTGVDQSLDLWDEFLQYPPLDVDGQDDLLFGLDQYLSSESPSSSSPSSDTSEKMLTPISSQNSSATVGADSGVLEGTDTSPQFPFLDPQSSLMNYTDFSLYSPGSSIFLDEEFTISRTSHQDLGPMPEISHAMNRDDPDQGMGLLANNGWLVDETSAQGLQSPSRDSNNEAPPGHFALPEASPNLCDLYGPMRTDAVCSPRLSSRMEQQSTCGKALTDSPNVDVAVPGSLITESVAVARNASPGRESGFIWCNIQNTSPLDGSQNIISRPDTQEDAMSHLLTTARDSSLRSSGNGRPEGGVHEMGFISLTATNDAASQQFSSSSSIEDFACSGSIHEHAQIQEPQNQESSTTQNLGRGAISTLIPQTRLFVMEGTSIASANQAQQQAVDGTTISSLSGYDISRHIVAGIEDAASASASDQLTPSTTWLARDGSLRGVRSTSQQSVSTTVTESRPEARTIQDLTPGSASMLHSLIRVALLVLGAFVHIPLLEVLAAIGATLVSALASGAFTWLPGDALRPSSRGACISPCSFYRSDQRQSGKGGPFTRTFPRRMDMARRLPMLVSL